MQRILLEKLKQRWKVKSLFDVVIILLVFALTGTSIMLLRKWMVGNFDFAKEKWFTYSYYWLIIPFYNVVLLVYGFLLGKFAFFWDFEKKTFKRIQGLFVKNKK